MEILRVMRGLPEYISWVRSGKPEIPPKNVPMPNFEDSVKQDVTNAISNLLGIGTQRGWTYSLDEGMAELGDPMVWSGIMPSWVDAFPELDGTTLTYINADSLGICDPGDPDYALTMDFRNLTTQWRIHSFFSKRESQILIEKAGAGEQNRSKYSGEEILKLELIKEAWCMAARVKKRVGLM